MSKWRNLNRTSHKMHAYCSLVNPVIMHKYIDKISWNHLRCVAIGIIIADAHLK